MQTKNNEKKINPQEAAQWLSVVTALVNLIKSIFTKKSPKPQSPPPPPIINNTNQDSLTNQNLNN